MHSQGLIAHIDPIQFERVPEYQSIQRLAFMSAVWIASRKSCVPVREFLDILGTFLASESDFVRLHALEAQQNAAAAKNILLSACILKLSVTVCVMAGSASHNRLPDCNNARRLVSKMLWRARAKRRCS